MVRNNNKSQILPEQKKSEGCDGGSSHIVVNIGHLKYETTGLENYSGNYIFKRIPHNPGAKDTVAMF